MTPTRAGAWKRAALAAGLLLALAACGNDDGDVAPEPPPTAARAVTIEGDATLDGEPFDSDFVGAVVVGEDGLVTPCQAEIPPVEGGDYEIPVLSERAGSGCGRPGSKVVLWTHDGERIVFSTNTLDWPETATDHARFDPAFDSDEPQGAAPDVAQFHGSVLDEDGRPAPAGTEVEAFVGDTRCGVASVREADEFLGYIVSVVGPDAVPGCARDVAITFRVEGEPATHNPVVNRPPGERDPIDLRR